MVKLMVIKDVVMMVCTNWDSEVVGRLMVIKDVVMMVCTSWDSEVVGRPFKTGAAVHSLL